MVVFNMFIRMTRYTIKRLDEETNRTIFVPTKHDSTCTNCNLVVLNLWLSVPKRAKPVN